MITHRRLKTLLRYNRRTGCFRWKVDRRSVLCRGQEAGSQHISGYIHIKLDGRLYKAHRLAWLYVTGKMPPEDVEHKNLKKAVNRWCNLRLTNDSLNQANTAWRKNNTGFKSVLRRENGRFRARISVNSVRINLGTFDTPDLAHAAYVAAAKKHFGEFARVR